MTDSDKSRFLSGIGQAANYITPAKCPDCGAERADAILSCDKEPCGLRGNTPTAAPDFETWWSAFIANYLPHGIEEHSAAKAAWNAAQSSLASQLSDLEAAKNDALTLANLREAEIERLREALANGATVIDRFFKDPHSNTSAGLLEVWQREARAIAQPPEPTDAR